MASTPRYIAMVLGGIGFVLATFVPIIVRSWAPQELLVGFSIAGGLLLFIGIAWSERRRQIEGMYDERVAGIQFRSGWYAFWVVMAPMFMMMTATVHTEFRPPPWGITVVFLGGFLVYVGMNQWLIRRE